MSRERNIERETNIERPKTPADEIDETEREYQGTSDTEEQGGIPAEPPRKDPLKGVDLRKPKAPPEHNM